jgi:FKBP-type peptidyl-prolyl cis-trans isomerase FklB
MKKISIFSIVGLIGIIIMTSCNNYKAKTVELKTLNDSLNYTLGLANGDQIKSYYLKNDSSDKAIEAIIKNLEQAYNSAESKNEIHKLGIQVGSTFKQLRVKGLMGDSTLKFDEKLVKQGMINGLNGFDQGMTQEQAQKYLQETMMKMQQQKMQSRPQISAPEVSAPEQPHQ